MSPAFGSAGPTMLEVLERVLESRKVGPPPGSYVAGLFRKGEAQICRKIGEEAAEVMTAALGGEGDARVVSEIADLWFHTMVLLTARGIPLRRVFQELGSRHAKGK
jgi:phosphoribosyl-ATP pyrophosphohydrolase